MAARFDPMNQDKKLSELLRGSRVSPSLPPRFQENVWRRIEDAEAPGAASDGVSLLDALVAMFLRPRFAYATVAALMLLGMLLGAYQSTRSAQHEAEARYIAAVAPNSLR